VPKDKYIVARVVACGTDKDLLATQLPKHQAMLVFEKSSHVVIVMNPEGQ